MGGGAVCASASCHSGAIPCALCGKGEDIRSVSCRPDTEVGSPWPTVPVLMICEAVPPSCLHHPQLGSEGNSAPGGGLGACPFLVQPRSRLCLEFPLLLLLK